MKKISTVFYLLLLNVISVAQNYNVINPQRAYYYEHSPVYFEFNYITISGIKLSNPAIVGNDTVFQNYRIIGDLCNPPFSGNNANDTGFAGEKIILKSNGDFIFFDTNQDSIFILPQKNLNEDWILCTFQNGSFFKASVDSIYQKNILTVTDSVKRISLQYFDSTGNPASHILNNKFLELGKTFGLITTLNFNHFPNDTMSYHLAGITNPDLGVKNISLADIYNFDVGDVFMYLSEWHFGFTQSDYGWLSDKILSKSYSINSDTLNYTIESKNLTKHFNLSNYTSNYTFDTITISILLSPDSFDRIQPEQLFHYTKAPILDYYYTGGFLPDVSLVMVNNTDTMYVNRAKKNVFGFVSLFLPDSCVNNGGGWCYEPSVTYVEGLGLTYFTEDGGNCGDDHLVYYQKGNEVWGIPFDIDLLAAQNEISAQNFSAQIFPNPFTDVLKIESPDAYKIDRVTVSDFLGRMLIDNSFHQNDHIQLETSLLQNGMYLIKLFLKGNKSLTYKVVKVSE